VQDLEEKKVEFIFMPYTIELEVEAGYLHGYTCPTTTIIPDLVRRQYPTVAAQPG
jgi:predicted nucleotide-binding protein (sugar kinase/HSP70/actin superfamily)